MSYYELPHDIDTAFAAFCHSLDDFQSGKLDALAFKTIRVPFGIYEQRTKDTYMVRIRLACGLVSRTQLQTINTLAALYAGGSIHVTTRGDVQLHSVGLDNVKTILTQLHGVGISSRGGGGNTLRNITADIYSKAPDSLFDVSVHGSRLTSRMLEDKESYALPRKFKIAFSSSAADRANATISDVGFIAAVQNGVRGFSVWIAGGMGAKSELGIKLYDFIEESQIYIVSQAIKTFFDTHGDRKRKHANRLRFLVRNIGFENAKAYIEDEIIRLKTRDDTYLSFENIQDEKHTDVARSHVEQSPENANAFARFAKIQGNGAYTIKIPLGLGDISSDSIKRLCEATEGLGENIFRFGQDQNIYLYDVDSSKCDAIITTALGIDKLVSLPDIVGDVVACAGASTCQLGIGLSRGASDAIVKRLLASHIELDRFAGVKIHISGCPNSCAKHLVADIGFFGKAGRFEGRLYPAYTVVVGASISAEGSEFAKTVGEVPAYRLPQLVETLLLSVDEGYEQRFSEWARTHLDTISALVNELNSIPSFDEDKNPYFDFGAEEIFSLKSRGAGECSAGMYDLIESDEKRAKVLAEEIKTHDTQSVREELLLVSARMLLVTRGEEARDKNGVLRAFLQHFCDTKLVSEQTTKTVSMALQNETEKLTSADIIALANDVFRLYGTMDNTLKFEAEKTVHDEAKQEALIHESNLRGVACPMNFVKTKMELSKLSGGEILEVLLDDGAPIENVPNSVRSEGHTVEAPIREGDGWRIRIIKKGSQ